MMWQASVNAIWARAHGTGFTATRAWRVGTMDIRLVEWSVGPGQAPRSRDRRDHSCSRSTSRPCMVSAQTTAIATTMIAIAQTGYHGSQANAAIALTTARITPTVRAHTAPENTPNPASTTMIPTSSWIQPQVVRSNWKMYFEPFT